MANDVLSAPTADDLAIAWAASAAALSSARIGRFSDVDPLTERLLAAHHPGLVRYAAGLGQVLTALLACEIAKAEELARHYLRFAEFEQPGRAIGEVILAQVLIAKGDLGDAVLLLRQATAALKHTGYSWGPMGLMWLARALGQQGDADGAAEVMRRADDSHGMRSELYSPELRLARAWTLAAARDVHGAIAAARDAARVAMSAGQRSIALLAHHDAVRLGDTHVAEGIARLNSEIPCALGLDRAATCAGAGRPRRRSPGQGGDRPRRRRHECVRGRRGRASGDGIDRERRPQGRIEGESTRGRAGPPMR